MPSTSADSFSPLGGKVLKTKQLTDGFIHEYRIPRNMKFSLSIVYQYFWNYCIVSTHVI